MKRVETRGAPRKRTAVVGALTARAVPVILAAAASVLAGCVPGERVAERPGEPAGARAPSSATLSPAAAEWPAANRPDVSGLRGAVVAGHPLAAAAGHAVLWRGGNAVDAAVTMAAVLAVVRPHMNGVGGDAFALFLDGRTGAVTALNGSGRAGALASPELFAERGLDAVPGKGALAVTVPGAVSAWAAALERHGTISLAEALEPAVVLARDGWVVTRTLDRDIARSSGTLNDAGQAIFRPGGSLPAVGGVLRNPALARTLEAVAAGGADAFYRGQPAERIAAFVAEGGGHLRLEDFHAHTADWTDPIAVNHGDHRVLAFPPNSQGMVQLQQLRMAEILDVAALGHNTEAYLHALVEIKRLAFADRDRWVADPAFADIPLARLLSDDYLRGRAALVGEAAAAAVSPGMGEALGEDPVQGDGDTVYLMAVDRWGNAVSWIQSLFAAWGSGLVEPETGVVLQNRGAGFVLTEGHPNRIAPRKRPFHTLTPMMVLAPDGGLRMTIGTPGGDGQSQFLTQVFHNIVAFGMTPQEAVEAPRFRSEAGRVLLLEDRIGRHVMAGLGARGHEPRPAGGWSATFGGVQVIYRDPVTGTLRTGADPRREAYGLAW
jgi:gamma-glutamyltranspeptidase / glutathione hydrolase